jgi:hypothetical protein
LCLCGLCVSGVYRACDTKLGREVAIKLLPDAFCTDPDSTSRFERETKRTKR